METHKTPVQGFDSRVKKRFLCLLLGFVVVVALLLFRSKTHNLSCNVVILFAMLFHAAKFVTNCKGIKVQT